MSNQNKMGNKNNKSKNNCIMNNPPEIENDDIYSDFIKNLKYDTNKIELNLKKCSKNNELIILIESGALAPPHRMHINIYLFIYLFIYLLNVLNIYLLFIIYYFIILVWKVKLGGWEFGCWSIFR